MQSAGISVNFVENDEVMKDFQLLIYNTPTEDVKVDVVLVDETIWANQKAMSALFDCTVQNISYHLGKVFETGELERSAVIKEFLNTAQSGARGISDEKIMYYNLDAIIAVGYRVSSARATAFRIWATGILKEYIKKGFVLDDRRTRI